MHSHYSITIVTTYGEGWVASYPTLEEAIAYASAIMSSSNAVEVLISAMTGDTGTLVKRYRRDDAQQPWAPTMLYSLTVLTASDETWVVTYPRLREATMYASVIMNSGGDATEVLVFCVTEGASTLVKRYHRDNA